MICELFGIAAKRIIFGNRHGKISNTSWFTIHRLDLEREEEQGWGEGEGGGGEERQEGSVYQRLHCHW